MRRLTALPRIVRVVRTSSNLKKLAVALLFVSMPRFLNRKMDAHLRRCFEGEFDTSVKRPSPE